jgi:hypothetical protein
VTISNVDPLAELNVAQEFERWRERRWTTEWGGVWTPRATSYEREVWDAAWEAAINALAEAGLIRHGVVE